MKKSFKQFGVIFAVAIFTLITSCSNDDNGGGGGSASVGTITGKAGGSSFTTISQGTTAMLASNGSFQNLAIQGATITGKTIQLVIIGQNIAAGTYQILDTDSETNAAAVYGELDINNPTSAQTWSAPYTGMANTSSIKITSISATNVKGTFTFTGQGENGTKNITDGSFNVNISAN